MAPALRFRPRTTSSWSSNQALLARQTAEIADSSFAQAERFLADQQLRQEAGSASDLDVLRAQVARDNLRPQQVQARNQLDLALLNLKRLVNVPLEQPVRLTNQLEETTGYVLTAIALAVILIFLILASQFESVTQPFAIMLSLPLSLIGVLLALLVTNDTLNMMSMIGVILLFGLVTKNAILLVDNANERRSHGRERHEALVEAGAARLRPIIMTTLAMIFGMLPIALALGEGGGFRAPMARAVIGGLITSTLLTLVVVPVAYTYFDDFSAWVGRRIGRGRDAADVGNATPAPPCGTR